MKKLLEQLKKQIEPLENECNKRDDYFDNKSDNWQETTTGQNYEEKTDQVGDLLSSIEECIDNIETYLE